jgi:microsomal dipeptidase-like Zn-dependent dipeptidase
MVGGERRLGERFHEGLFQRGHPPEVVRAVLGGNFLRIMEEVGMA